eukprot:9489901-Pyramimonas_sp.AAC.2
MSKKLKKSVSKRKSVKRRQSEKPSPDALIVVPSRETLFERVRSWKWVLLGAFAIICLPTWHIVAAAADRASVYPDVPIEARLQVQASENRHAY